MPHPSAASARHTYDRKMRPEGLHEIHDHFKSFCRDGEHTIKTKEITNVLLSCGEKVPAYKIRQALEIQRIAANGQVNFQEFTKLFEQVAAAKISTSLVSFATKATMQVTGGQSFVSAQGTQHSYDDDDKTAFAEWVNGVIEKDEELAGYFPIDTESPVALFESLKDGIILCKLVNWSSPGTVDERAINRTKLNVYTIHENITLALNSASAIGCGIINIGPEDILNGTPHLVLGLLWQLLRVGLFTASSVKNFPGLESLLEGCETVEDLLRMSQENILLRWVNYHLKNAECPRIMKNFKRDLRDSEIYRVLLRQICPKDIQLDLELSKFKTSDDLEDRAKKVINAAAKMKCRKFIKARDILHENARLNLAFLCHCFYMYPCLEEIIEVKDTEKEVEGITAETREERAFRNWMNSLGVDPFVSDLHHELQDGWVLLQVLEIISKSLLPVNMGEIQKPPFKKTGANMKRLENCNNVVRICTEMKMSTVGIAGCDIRDGNIKLTLAIIWQMMKMYTLSILQKCSKSDKPINEKQIIQWTNRKLAEGGKHTQISSFKDDSIASSIVILDLIDTIRPNSVNYSLIRAGKNEQEKLSNATYAISLARKIGANVYALPEDIVEVKSKMVMTVFACLMVQEAMESGKRVDQDVSQKFDQEVRKIVDQDVSKKVSQDVSKKIDQHMSKKIYQDVKKKVDEHVSKKANQNLKKKVDQDVSKHVYQNESKMVDQVMIEKVDQDVNIKVEDVSKNVDQNESKKVDQDVIEKVDQDVSIKAEDVSIRVDQDVNGNVDQEGMSEKVDADMSEKVYQHVRIKIDQDMNVKIDQDLNEKVDKEDTKL